MEQPTATVEFEAVHLDKDSTQSQVIDSYDTYGTPDECVHPPFAPEGYAFLTESSGVRRAALEAISLNVVGLGYSLDPKARNEAEEGDGAGQRMDQAREALENAAARDARLENPSFCELMRAVKYDEEEVGQGFLEVSKNKTTGLIDGLYHLPAKRMRRRTDRTGWVLLPPDGDPKRGVFYASYGTKFQRGPDGKPTGKLTGKVAQGVNEVLVFKLYASESRDYGTPRDAALAIDYLADKLASEANVSFFRSSGTPPTILFVGGEESRNGQKVKFKVPQEAVQKIANTLRADAGVGSRVAIIPMPPGTTAKEVRLGEVSTRDLGYNEFRGEHAKRVLGAFRLQPIFVPVVDTNGRYDAEVQRAITLEQVFDPEQDRYEAKATRLLLADLGYGDLTLTFKRLAVEADAARREAAERMAEVGALTYGEFREAHGYKPLPEDGAQVPAEWNKTLVPVMQPGAPEGAQNRVNAADDQRGLRPGIGGRVSRDKTTGAPRHVEATVTSLADAVRGQTGAATARAIDRARRTA
jgi:hypothetical protein